MTVIEFQTDEHYDKKCLFCVRITLAACFKNSVCADLDMKMGFRIFYFNPLLLISHLDFEVIN